MVSGSGIDNISSFVVVSSSVCVGDEVSVADAVDVVSVVGALFVSVDVDVLVGGVVVL